MFIEFDTIDGFHVSLRVETIWFVTKILDNSKPSEVPSEVVLEGGQTSIKIDAETAESIQAYIRENGSR